jgi:16S rRNA G966 N2-methylase RsmD
MQELTYYNAARHALQQAASIDEVKDIKDKAEAIRLYAQQQKDSALEQYAAQIKTRSMRRLGILSAELEKAENQHARPTGGTGKREALKEAGLSKSTAHRCEKLAEMPEKEFEKRISEGASATELLKEKRAEELQVEREAIKRKADNIPQNAKWHIECGDIESFQTDQRFDFIITDPPYHKEHVQLYGKLSYRAAELLVPGGMVIAMCGNLYLNQIYAIMSEQLEYYWTCAYLMPGQPTPLRQRNINSSWKPLLCFTRKGEKYTGKGIGDVFKSDGNDKNLHEWGQSESGMYDIISKICLPGQSIFDPFCGAGTTGIAALKHGCLFTGIDIDPETVKLAKGRLYQDDAKAA